MPILKIILSLQTWRYNKRLRNSSTTCDIFSTPRLCRSASVRVHVEVRNGYGRATGVWAASPWRRSNEANWPRIPVPRIAYWGRDKKNNCWDRMPEKLKGRIYIFISDPFRDFGIHCPQRTSLFLHSTAHLARLGKTLLSRSTHPYLLCLRLRQTFCVDRLTACLQDYM